VSPKCNQRPATRRNWRALGAHTTTRSRRRKPANRLAGPPLTWLVLKSGACTGAANASMLPPISGRISGRSVSPPTIVMAPGAALGQSDSLRMRRASRDLHMWARRGRRPRSAFLIAGDVFTLAEAVVASRSARDGLADANRHVSIIGHSGRNRPVLGCGCLAARAARGRTDSKGPGPTAREPRAPTGWWRAARHLAVKFFNMQPEGPSASNPTTAVSTS